MHIRTKIIATLGPASTRLEILRGMAEAGADVFRINFSHGTPGERTEAVRTIRRVEAELERPLGILADLCGPKIRVGPLAESSVRLDDGQTLVIRREPVTGDREQLSTTLGELVDQVRVGERLLLDDGKLRLEVIETGRLDRVVCRVVRGGMLAGGKGVNMPDTQLDLPALTEKDRVDAAWIAERDFDFVAQSFVRHPSDLDDLRKQLAAAGRSLPVIAKIEKPQAMERIGEIVAASDGIMVARGDLGVEMDLPAVPVAQKTVARECVIQAKPCIIATQMLESMTLHKWPTRAEVSDVANAVLDHADAVMLSGETAVGRHPVATVHMMNAVVSAIQEYHDRALTNLDFPPRRLPATLAALAESVRGFTARERIAAIAVFTMTGRTAQIFAKHRPACPILGLSPEQESIRRMSLYYGVLGMHTPRISQPDEILAMASDFATRRGIAKQGDKLLVVAGQPVGKPGLTNTLVAHTIP